MLDENNHLIQCIMDYQNKGKTSECSQVSATINCALNNSHAKDLYQQMLHTNLVYLATIADSNQNMQSLLPANCVKSVKVMWIWSDFSDMMTIDEIIKLRKSIGKIESLIQLFGSQLSSPQSDGTAILCLDFISLLRSKPPTQNMPMGPGGMNQTGPPPPPRSHNMASDGMVGGGPPAPHMQNQMNGQMPGPNHMPIQGPGPNQLNMTNSSMNMPSSSHGSMGGYNHSVPSSQSMPVQNQMTMSQGQPMGNYGPRPNMNMQPNQGRLKVQNNSKIQSVLDQKGVHMFLHTVWLPEERARIVNDSDSSYKSKNTKENYNYQKRERESYTRWKKLEETAF
ncbi:hypothetical protein HPG69_003811 [Diceros bicornis minor]|uniref:SS18 N-terminal domain-containing protein n=1 Tax=Diceros bicornis minor TaxID=77932 RepID=A0A7J7EU10_DICBM|nr:hypothetical protein HPG69_003811 [Diceros bicornis minor]